MKMMQPINDERLIIKNMKNIRIIYALQTLGIVAILGYDFVIIGMDGIKENPLWLVFIASTVLLAFLSMTSDERLALKNLQKLRIAYGVQILGIVGILGYDFITSGMDGMRENPLSFVFIVSMTIGAFLSMNVNVDHENNKTSAKKELIISLIVVALISIIVGIFTSFSEGFTAIGGLLAGVIILICGLIPFTFLFYLRKTKDDDNDA
ncbi:hypothetical protein [Lentibacillus sediminis]|uniref:hypothetical protein n=1 Tax=Lentibacillus sediminis TaxID=1940529 RepID=UPI001EFC54FE|nr:hypothetical protein [Lentibacillus sediminis]